MSIYGAHFGASDSAFVHGLDEAALASAAKITKLVMEPIPECEFRSKAEVVYSEAMAIILEAHGNAVDASAIAHAGMFPEVAARHVEWARQRVTRLAQELSRQVSLPDKPVRIRTAQLLREAQALLDILEKIIPATNR